LVTILPTNKIFFSVRWTIVFTYLAIIVIAFGVIIVSVTRIVEDYLVQQRVVEQQKSVDNIAIQVAPYLENADADYMLQMAIDHGQALGGRVLILNQDGVVQVDGFSELNGTKLRHSEVVDVLRGSKDRAHGFHLIKHNDPEENRGGRFNRNNDTWVVYYTSVITYNARRIGAVLLSISIQDVMDKITEIRSRLIIYSFVVSTLVAFFSFIISGLITKPVTELTQAILYMSRGHFDKRVRVMGRNEIGQLAMAFNTMSEKLENLDRARNEFVSNASHELKTPLSSMKILIETIIHQDVFDQAMVREFLGDINSEIDRLTAIINDLLTLVRMDKTDVQIQKEEIHFGDLVSRTVQRLIPIARNRGIEIEMILRENVMILGDRLKLEQMISNLVDNGIKYTPEGGKVTVELFRKGRNVLLQVSDTGIGIPAEDIPHIFERFFRVDKARFRGSGGTGLGLSIVHRIVLLHGGDITVSSEEGKGSVFTVELPIHSP